jgi:hypothetical protein
MKTIGNERRSGLPDIIGFVRGEAFGLEVKRPGGKVTVLQRDTLDRMQKAGAVVAVVYSTQEVRDIFAQRGWHLIQNLAPSQGVFAGSHGASSGII